MGHEPLPLEKTGFLARWSGEVLTRHPRPTPRTASDLCCLREGRPCATLIATIFGGTTEIMKEIIGRSLGL
jgi:hypothetical protein